MARPVAMITQALVVGSCLMMDIGAFPCRIIPCQGPSQAIGNASKLAATGVQRMRLFYSPCPTAPT